MTVKMVEVCSGNLILRRLYFNGVPSRAQVLAELDRQTPSPTPYAYQLARAAIECGQYRYPVEDVAVVVVGPTEPPAPR